MRLERITVVNIRKHFWRLGLLTAGLAVAVATVVALYTLSILMNEDWQKKLDEYGTNMVIVPKTDNLPLSYAGVALGGVSLGNRTLTEADVKALRTIQARRNLAVIAPQLIGAAAINKRDAIIVGIPFSEEFRIKRWWRLQTGKKPTPATNQALIGGSAATRLGIKQGQTIKIKGEQFQVAGILRRVGSQEDEPVYIDLKKAQNMFGRPGQFSLIEVAAWCYNCPIERIVGQASEKLPNAKVSAVRQAVETRNVIVKQFGLFAVILSGVMAIVGGLIIFTNMLAAVRERRREIGIFRAIGFRRLNILEIILFETVLVALAAGIIGYLAGLSAAGLLAPSLGVGVPVTLNLNVAYFAMLGTLLLTLVSSLYPALTAANLSPMIAINDI
ncbi:MAG: ABC transporter permease [Actinomycetota bacterium]|nr:ABC transporter permease [Actinomycetota bacterium]